MKNFWNQRYEEEHYAYGLLPNRFFKEELDRLPAGSLLLPAEGEGRNAVYAAKKGWDVTAFDFSPAAKAKAERLADSQSAKISFHVTDVMNFSTEMQFDTIALIYAHFPVSIRLHAHKHLIQFLKPQGHIIFEAFSKEQLGNSSGGPKDLEMLFSISELKKEFPTLEFLTLKEDLIELKEGLFHRGTASVIRFIAKNTTIVKNC